MPDLEGHNAIIFVVFMLVTLYGAIQIMLSRYRLWIVLLIIALASIIFIFMEARSEAVVPPTKNPCVTLGVWVIRASEDVADEYRSYARCAKTSKSYEDCETTYYKLIDNIEQLNSMVNMWEMKGCRKGR